MGKGSRVPLVDRGYHASLTDIKEGDHIVPHGVTGNRNFSISSHQDTYFVPAGENKSIGNGVQGDNEAAAWSWASMITDNSTFMDGSNYGGRPRVYLTTPSSPQHLDSNLNGQDVEAEYSHSPAKWQSLLDTAPRVADNQKVLDTRWAPPAWRKGVSVEQTLPHVNWNQFGAPNWITHVDATTRDDTGRDMLPRNSVSSSMRIRSAYSLPVTEAPPTPPTPRPGPGQQSLDLQGR